MAAMGFRQLPRRAVRSMLLASAGCVLAWQLLGAVFAAPRAVQQPWRAEAPLVAAASRPGLRASNPPAASQLYAELDDDLPVKRQKKEWEPPFPKYMVGAGIFFAIVGFAGGGPVLAFVFGISGVGFGTLFEPFQTDDGTISGLD
mmetsp:Transcript_30740/g.69897  ORF Transcript_30740/g.69897 Transcript_30740/m.69897 type:complete len:145 (+) Transcript_30740:77-511(+)